MEWQFSAATQQQRSSDGSLRHTPAPRRRRSGRPTLLTAESHLQSPRPLHCAARVSVGGRYVCAWCVRSQADGWDRVLHHASAPCKRARALALLSGSGLPARVLRGLARPTAVEGARRNGKREKASVPACPGLRGGLQRARPLLAAGRRRHALIRHAPRARRDRKCRRSRCPACWRASWRCWRSARRVPFRLPP